MPPEKKKYDIVEQKLKGFTSLKKQVQSYLQKPTTNEDGREMNNLRLDELLGKNQKVSRIQRRSEGVWTFHYEASECLIMTDEKANRMRIVSLLDSRPLQQQSRKPSRLLQANWHEALDVKFCYDQEGQLWIAFMHPLSLLTPVELDSALEQIGRVAAGYPGGLHSTDFTFTGEPQLDLG